MITLSIAIRARCKGAGMSNWGEAQWRRRLVAAYAVVVPMVVGGYAHTPEWRIRTYVGKLAWWWRALAWSRLGCSLGRVRLHEALLFGSHHGEIGRGWVTVRDLSHEVPQAEGYWPEWQALFGANAKAVNVADAVRNWSGLRYLAGPGFARPNMAKNDPGRHAVPQRALRVEILYEPRTLEALAGRLRKPSPGLRPVYTLAEFEGALFAEHREVAFSCLVDAVRLLGLLGGLGARERRGFGSLNLRHLSVQVGQADSTWSELEASDGGLWSDRQAGGETDQQARVGAYVCRVQAAIGEAARVVPRPPYSALSSCTRVILLGYGSNPVNLMNLLGWSFNWFRTYGAPEIATKDAGPFSYQVRPTGGGHSLVFSDGSAASQCMVRRQHSSYGFKDDHDWYVDVGSYNANLRDPAHRSAPRRAAFGLPMLFQALQEGRDADAAPPASPYDLGRDYTEPRNHDTRWRLKGRTRIAVSTSQARSFGRRASPLLLHIQRLDEGLYVAVGVALNAQFLPTDVEIEIDRLRAGRQFQVSASSLELDAVNAFLDFAASGEALAQAELKGRTAGFNLFNDPTGRAVGVEVFP
jgi:hypothetical protein